jgi:hypothetical protein
MRGQYPMLVSSWPRVFVLPTAAFVLVFTLGVGSFAYASPSVTDSHPLYAVKSGMELVEEKIHRSPESKARYHAKMMQRRIAEGEHELKFEQLAERHINGIAEEFSNSINNINVVEAELPSRKEIVEQLKVQVVRYDYLMQTAEAAAADMSVRDQMQIWVAESDLTDEQKEGLSLYLQHQRPLELPDEFQADINIDEFTSDPEGGQERTKPQRDLPRVRVN